MLRNIMSCAIAMSVAICSISEAAPLFFTNEAAFQTAASGISLQTETFDTTPGVDSFTNTTPFSTVAENITLSNIGTSTFGNRAPAQHGSGNAAAWANSGNGPLTFTFPSPINAFGIDIWDLGDFGATTLTLTTETGSQVLFPGFVGPDDNMLFGGIVDTTMAFVSATFSNTETTDYVEFDDLQFGSIIPEPTTLTLATLALLGINYRRRRQV